MINHAAKLSLEHPAKAPRGSVDGAETEFSLLADRWRSERARGVDLMDLTSSPAYLDIVKMGPRAIRPILLQMKREIEHWFPALHEITGENPVSVEIEGKLKLIAEAWLRWGRERGYLSELEDLWAAL